MTPPLLTLLAFALSTGTSSGSGAIPTQPAPPGDAPTLTSGGLIWSYNAGYGAAIAALGDRGGHVVVGNTLTDIQLFSSFDSSPPVPVWQGSFADDGGGEIAAREANVYLASEILVTLPSTSQAILHKYTSSSAVPDWSFEFVPQLFSFVQYGVSRDGRVIVSSYYDEATVEAQIRVHDPTTGIPTKEFVLPTPTFGGRLYVSPDGSMVARSRGPITNSYTDVIDLETESVVFTTPGMLPWKQGISDQGRVLVVAEKVAGEGWHVRVFVRESGSYREVIDRVTPPFLHLPEMAVSEDGSTVAAAWFHETTPGRFVVRAFDVASATMTMERGLPVPSLFNLPSDIAISADGSRFVVGCYGDGQGLAAEVAVYSPRRSEPLVEYPVGGTVFSADISPDGDRFVVSRAPGHAYNGYNHTKVEMYEVGGEDLVVRGRPSIGETIEFEVHGRAGATAMLLSAPRLAPQPIVFPGIGTLVLGPSLLQVAHLGVMPAGGIGVFPFTIAADPALIGRTTYYQVLTGTPRMLTNDWVQLTALP